MRKLLVGVLSIAAVAVTAPAFARNSYTRVVVLERGAIPIETNTYGTPLVIRFDGGGAPWRHYVEEVYATRGNCHLSVVHRDDGKVRKFRRCW